MDAKQASDRVIRVLLVDDHTLFRKGLRQLLAPEQDIVVVGEAGTGDEAEALVHELQPDIVLMDINMPGSDGITATRNIRAAHPRTSVIMLTMYREDEYALQAIRAGAQGYLVKHAEPEEIIAAIRLTSQGAAVVEPALVPNLLRELQRLGQDHERPPAIDLNDRELALVRLLVEGKDNTEMARELQLSLSTIKNNLSALFDKLGVQSRTQAAIYAMAYNLLAEPAS